MLETSDRRRRRFVALLAGVRSTTTTACADLFGLRPTHCACSMTATVEATVRSRLSDKRDLDQVSSRWTQSYPATVPRFTRRWSGPPFGTRTSKPTA
jgi:hypothetical protein